MIPEQETGLAVVRSEAIIVTNVSTTTAPSPLSVRRRRRASRPSADDRSLAILDTAQRLLQRRQWADISVEELAAGAHLSRPSFYSYFDSNDAVLLSLVKQALAETDSVPDSLPGRLFGEPQEIWRAGIGAFLEAVISPRTAALIKAAAASSNREVRKAGSDHIGRWSGDIAAMIVSERARGAARTHLPAQDLATALSLLNERVITAALAAEQPFHAQHRIVDSLAHIWLSSIYPRMPTRGVTSIRKE